MGRQPSDQQIEKELFTIAGDPDVVAEARKKYPKHGSLQNGIAQDMRLDRMCDANPIIRYKEFVLEGDLYIAPDGSELTLILICPKCHHQLQVSSKRKKIDWDRERGLISVEPFECTWEEGRGTDGTQDDRIAFGVGLCRWRVGIDGGIARDA